jgi:fused signal recognition particle receptor
MVFRALFNKIKQGLAKTRGVFTGVASLFRLKGRVDKSFLEELEKRLYQADVGTVAIRDIIERVRQAFLDKEITGDVEAFVKQQLREQLTSENTALRWSTSGPTVVMVAGVNGSGKTTSIAKLARRLQEDGKKVIVAACDTFRAAAVEQLTIWSQRIGCDIVKNQQGSDPASVAFDACDKAKARNFDVLIVDTAGRLHTQVHLMRELEKIRRIVGQRIEGAPHEVLLVLDATVGRNAVVQENVFGNMIGVTGIVMTKLDGTARGGVLVPVAQASDSPIKLVGVGEGVDDLQAFDARAFSRSLVGLEA